MKIANRFLAFAIMLISMFAASLFFSASLSTQKAFAEGDDQLTLTVPTQFPCALLGDGTIIEPDWTVTNSANKDASISAVNVDYGYLNANQIGGVLKFGENNVYEKSIDLALGKTRATSLISKSILPNSSKVFSIRIELDTTSKNVYKLYSASSMNPVSILDLSMTYTMPLEGNLTINGDKVSGSVINSSLIDFPEDAVASYQWYKDGEAIDGATQAAYTVQEGDIGSTITCKVVDSSGKYVGEVLSNEVGKIQAVVTFKDWDGTVLKTERVEKGEAATAPETPTRTGYTFVSWTEDFSKVTTNMIIKAKYELNTYTVSFETNGGNAINSQTVNYGGKATKPSTDPTKDNRTFYGYYSDENCTTEFDWNTEIIKDTTIYLNWVQDNYQLYEPGSGSYHYVPKGNEYNVNTSSGWIDQGLAFSTTDKGSTPVHRWFRYCNIVANTIVAHVYSLNSNYRTDTQHWTYENWTFYSAGSVPIYEFYNPSTDNYYYSKNENALSGFYKVGITFYSIK